MRDWWSWEIASDEQKENQAKTENVRSNLEEMKHSSKFHQRKHQMFSKQLHQNITLRMGMKSFLVMLIRQLTIQYTVPSLIFNGVQKLGLMTRRSSYLAWM